MKTNLLRPLLVIHGGAGVAALDRLAPEILAAAKSGLRRSLETGARILAEGGTAVDAVEAAVGAMEEDETFNAGIGGALTSAGHVEHEAAIMDGNTLRAGAVTGTQRVLRPVALARRLMDSDGHILLAGEGAEAFALEVGESLVDPGIFVTERRRKALIRVQSEKARETLDEQDKHGTVGAVALDAYGCLAAATSTGGRTNKRPGRIGDTPLIGAGTYADSRSVAVSCTGLGEAFMRRVSAHKVAMLMELGGLDVATAAARALAEIQEVGGSGGLIALDRHGNYAMPFDTAGMYRGVIFADGSVKIGVHREFCGAD